MVTGCFHLTGCSLLLKKTPNLTPSEKHNVFCFGESLKTTWEHSSWQCESCLIKSSTAWCSGLFPLSVPLWSVAVGYITARYQVSPCGLSQQAMKGIEHCLLLPEIPWESNQKMVSPLIPLLCWDGTHAWTVIVGWSRQRDGLGWHMGSTMSNLML